MNASYFVMNQTHFQMRLEFAMKMSKLARGIKYGHINKDFLPLQIFLNVF